MKREEWRQAMQNEADSVEDTVWARQTRHTVKWQELSPLLWLALVSVLAGLLGTWGAAWEAVQFNAGRNGLSVPAYLLEGGLLHSRPLAASWSAEQLQHFPTVLGLLALLAGAWARRLGLPLWSGILLPQVGLALGAGWGISAAQIADRVLPGDGGLGVLPGLLAALGWALVNWGSHDARRLAR